LEKVEEIHFAVIGKCHLLRKTDEEICGYKLVDPTDSWFDPNSPRENVLSCVRDPATATCVGEVETEKTYYKRLSNLE
jgi:hypothetical protein